MTDVRIDPKTIQGETIYACVARIVESLKAPAFEGTKPEAFRFRLKTCNEQPAPATSKGKEKSKPRRERKGVTR